MTMSIKLLLNSLYGSKAKPKSPYYDPAVVDAITAEARFALIGMKEILERENCPVRYGDTDSLFVDLQNKTMTPDDVIEIAKQEFGITLKLKWIWKYVIIADQKVYCGVTNQGKVEGTVFTGERKDSNEYFNEVTKTLKTMLLDIDGTVEYVKLAFRNLEQSKDKLCFTKNSKTPAYIENKTKSWKTEIWNELVEKYGIEEAKEHCDDIKIWKVEGDRKTSIYADKYPLNYKTYKRQLWTTIKNFLIPLGNEKVKNLKAELVGVKVKKPRKR